MRTKDVYGIHNGKRYVERFYYKNGRWENKDSILIDKTRTLPPGYIEKFRTMLIQKHLIETKSVDTN